MAASRDQLLPRTATAPRSCVLNIIYTLNLIDAHRACVVWRPWRRSAMRSPWPTHCTRQDKW
jgi:hypothetical protein